MVTPQLIVRGMDELLASLEVAPELMVAENEKAMGEAAFLAEAEIKNLTPRKTRRLFSGWGAHVNGFGMNTVAVVGNSVSYGPFVEEDTNAHDIVAHGNALMIPVAGGGGFGGGKLSGGARAGQQVAFFKKVRHPGTKGQHMAARGLENAKAGILEIFNLAIQRVLATIK